MVDSKMEDSVVHRILSRHTFQSLRLLVSLPQFFT